MQRWWHKGTSSEHQPRLCLILPWGTRVGGKVEEPKDKFPSNSSPGFCCWLQEVRGGASAPCAGSTPCVRAGTAAGGLASMSPP